MIRRARASVGAMWLIASFAVCADTVYLEPEAFLKQTFGTVPRPGVLWLTNDVQEKLKAILGHRYPQARLRYWRVEDRTAWILEEIGKEQPITAGFVVVGTRIADAEVLVYRESRGSEVHLPAFLKQFAGSSLNDDQLSTHIDGIAGATLSVRAMQRMARTALLLNRIAQ
jgi:metallophosphoesterase superfamily enzyme